jgi:succinate dehydrogenase / fumarate reductase iron-sulfur subunit
MSLTFKVLRFDPNKNTHPHFQAYEHEPKPKDSVLEALKDIRDQQDPSISFRYSCREAVCGSCGMVINGQIGLACRTQVLDLNSEVVVVEPLPNFEIQKDLIVDLTPFWDAYRAIEPFLQAPGDVPEKGHRVGEKDMEKVFQYMTCIMCACCTSGCPVATRDDRYLGPAALAKLFRFVVDPRDQRPFSALKKVDSPAGVWGCDTVFRCNAVCPKNVRPADGIEGLRRRLIGKSFKRLIRRDR